MIVDSCSIKCRVTRVCISPAAAAKSCLSFEKFPVSLYYSFIRMPSRDWFRPPLEVRTPQSFESRSSCCASHTNLATLIPIFIKLIMYVRFKCIRICNGIAKAAPP